MVTSGLERGHDWKDGFLFIGNHLTLDLLNTRPIQNGEPQELLPDFKALLRWFRAAELLNTREFATLQRKWESSARARVLLEKIRRLREDIREEVLSWEAGGKVHRAAIEKLNRLLAAHPMQTKIVATARGLRVIPCFEAHEPGDLLSPLAHSAARLFTEADHTRVRKCSHCVLHFLDTSKKGTRRWCSMQLCGNRLKVAAYAARQRSREKRNF
ncbi:MAG TPA: ABATE domain-containing protein [Terriglobales bacterium]|nr:ABATE domain-containing protein [Terriglobales bacterium]